MNTGSGKTICSIHLISIYKLKTLIVVNTIELMNQWIEALFKFLPSASVGKIQGNVFESDKDIVIGMIQTISMRKEYTRQSFKDFSLVFIDEVHHLSSEVFSEALFKIRNKYVFGLSATISRKDGLEYIFKYHIGDVLYTDINGKKQYTDFIKLDYRGISKELYLPNGKPKISTMLTELAEDLQRTQMICDFLKTLGNGRRVLVLSDRIYQLQTMYKILGSDRSGMYTGKTPKKDKDISKTKQIMLATYQIASEGFDHPVLNTLLFATPRSNIEQAIGRIYRKVHTITPMIIDIVDNFSVFPYQYKKRKTIYFKNINSAKGVSHEECLFD
jgi:superfamily II DNA or RNA helicase